MGSMTPTCTRTAPDALEWRIADGLTAYPGRPRR